MLLTTARRTLSPLLSTPPSSFLSKSYHIDSIDAIEADDDIAELDAQNQLYVLEMILSFHAWYKSVSPYFWDQNKEAK